MSRSMLEYELEALPEYELEALPEYESEFEGEFEGELEGEYESELFFRRLGRLARRAGRSPRLRRVGLAAARTAIGGLGSIGGAIGGAPGTRGARIGQNIGGHLGVVLGNLLPQGEYEGEFEAEVNPIRRIYPDALMEHLGHAAAAAESEEEAEAFIGALVPIAARLIPRVAPTIMRAAPALARGLTNVTRTLRRSRGTRPLIRTLPTIMRRTTANIARQAAQGRQVTPRAAVRTLARETARVISSPQQSVRAYQRSRALDRRYHHAARPGSRTTTRRARSRSGQREW